MSIVQVNVSTVSAPIPSWLQKTGALLSQGGTTTAANTRTLITQLADLTAILAAPLALTSLTSSGTVATATTTAPHGVTTGDTFLTTVAGASPAGYDGTFLATATGASAFTYAVPSGLTTPAT